MQRVRVKTAFSYDVVIGEGTLGLLAERIRKGTAAIITDDTVKELYAEHIQKELQDNGVRVIMYSIKPGEASKSFEEYGRITGFLADNHFTRSDVVLAVGGGVVGDLAGFVAGTYLRGVRFIQVPTTFLAAIDSSVGGKTGINLPEGKNLLGVFFQPELVICDTKTLATLSEEIFSDGVAEAIKYGIIEGRELFEIVSSGNIADYLEDVIASCVRIKSDLVAMDEFDRGARQMLNLGHTIGHAIEKCSSYSISHGNALSIGMAMISGAAREQGLCKCHAEIEEALLKNNLPTTTDIEKQRLLDAILSDKKRMDDRISSILPVDIGKCMLHNIALNEIELFI